ncbi:hypothetical protein ABZX85_17835 [Streptomyces sp. NPDC004539]|uniref:hypothetical protein n=1 Tax=Streptomyces sp. NPDC004539 TaxID=3154280 RepID=UPI0033AE246F
MRTRWTRTALGITAVAALLTSCAAEAAEAPDLSAVPTDRVADEIFQSDAIDLIEYVRNRLTADCMDEQGYPQLKRTRLSTRTKPFTDMDVRPPLFTTRTDEQAALYGFGENRAPESANVLSHDRGFDRRLDTCQDAAGRRLGPEFDKVQNQSYQLYNDVADERDALLKTPEETAVTAAALRPMLACVENTGFRQRTSGARDLDAFGIGRPTGRYEGAEPPDPRAVPGTVEILPAVPERRYVPTAEESRLAVAAARCARETGFGEKITAQRVRVLRVVVAGHAAEVGELRPQVEEMAKTAAKLEGR